KRRKAERTAQAIDSYQSSPLFFTLCNESLSPKILNQLDLTMGVLVIHLDDTAENKGTFILFLRWLALFIIKHWMRV
ncbi:MAG: hypothetical protein COB24_09865, partial [Hyphomicrobiales bacterium]